MTSRLLELGAHELRQLGVSMQIVDSVLVVSFDDGRREYWTEAPHDYPVDGSVEAILFDGVVYQPAPYEAVH